MKHALQIASLCAAAVFAQTVAASAARETAYIAFNNQTTHCVLFKATEHFSGATREVVVKPHFAWTLKFTDLTYTFTALPAATADCAGPFNGKQPPSVTMNVDHVISHVTLEHDGRLLAQGLGHKLR